MNNDSTVENLTYFRGYNMAIFTKCKHLYCPWGLPTTVNGLNWPTGGPTGDICLRRPYISLLYILIAL